jgi:quercetin dioxygenase-like cupin family protein
MATSMREEIEVGDLAVRFLVEGGQSGGSLAVFEFDVPVGANVVPHSHDGYEETIYGLAGVLTWTVEGTPVDVGPDEALCILRGAVHHFENTGDVDATALAIVTPGILGPDYFRAVAAVRDAAAGSPPDTAVGGRLGLGAMSEVIAGVDTSCATVPISGGEVILRSEKREISILVACDDLTITRARYAAGEPVTGPHIHHEHTDAFYVLEGDLTFEIGHERETVTISAGGFVAVPPGVAHSFRTVGDRPARWLTIHAHDGGFAAFMRGVRDGVQVKWDISPPPAGGGLSASEAIVSRGGGRTAARRRR